MNIAFLSYSLRQQHKYIMHSFLLAESHFDQYLHIKDAKWLGWGDGAKGKVFSAQVRGTEWEEFTELT